MRIDHIEFELETKHFTVWVWEEDAEIHEDVNSRCYGAFEHKVYGDEYAGGLWFEWEGKTAVLYDYDGVPGYVPKEVAEALTKEGFDMSYGRPEPPFDLKESLDRSVDI